MNPKDLPPGMNIVHFNTFAVETWERNADLAYKGYLMYGRGMVNWLWRPVTKIFYLNGYATLDEAIAKNFNTHCINIIKTYDPQQSLVLTISWEISPETYNTYYALIKLLNSGSPQSIYF